MKTPLQIARQRLANLRLTGRPFATPSDVVAALGAVQAQDYAGAKWAVAQRTKAAVDSTVEQALIDGTILRTHVLRPTWHFVTPADIRWMLSLTAPRINTVMGYYNRHLELDDAVFLRSNDTLARALEGGRHLTRAELAQALRLSRINVKQPTRLVRLLMRAEQDAVICSGAPRGKQSTYALLDERAAPTPPIERDEALLRLAKTYFATRGPATTLDFAWWAGITLGDARRGIDMGRSSLKRETVDGHSVWSGLPASRARKESSSAHLLPIYDEFFVSYKDRSASVRRLSRAGVDTQTNLLFGNNVVVDGQLVGTWKRALGRDGVVVELSVLTRLTQADRKAVAAAAQRYGDFLELPVEIRD
jgi:hypothetical protein